MLLQIKNQGFPSLLTQLGVQSPLQGPFWGFESTVVPTFVLGSYNLQENVGAFPYQVTDQASSTIINAGSQTQLLQSPGLPQGRYAIKINWSFINAALVASSILFKIRQFNTGSVLRTVALTPMSAAGKGFDHGRGSENFEENMGDGDFFYLENLTSITPSEIRTSWRFTRLGEIFRGV